MKKTLALIFICVMAIATVAYGSRAIIVGSNRGIVLHSNSTTTTPEAAWTAWGTWEK